MSNINMETNNVHNVKILPMQTPTSSAGSHSWRIKFMRFEIKPFFKKHPDIMQRKALNNSQACFLNNALSAFPYLHR